MSTTLNEGDSYWDISYPEQEWLTNPMALLNASLNGQMENEEKFQVVNIPHVYVTPLDTIAVVLSHAVLVEITISKNIRICQVGTVAATITEGGRMAAIHHPAAEIVQQEAQINADLPQGTRIRMSYNVIRVLPAPSYQLFTEPNLGLPTQDQNCADFDPHHDSNYEGMDSASIVQSGWNLTEGEGLRWMEMPVEMCMPLPRGTDLTSPIFLHEPWINLAAWPPKSDRCVDIANRVVLYPDWKERQQLTILIHGIKIRQDLRSGDIRVYSARNYLSLQVNTGALTLHSPWVDLNVDRWAQIRIRRAEQYAQTTSTRLSIGDGPDKKTEFDLWGRLVNTESFQIDHIWQDQSHA